MARTRPRPLVHDQHRPGRQAGQVKSDRYGTGLRYRARYIGPDGSEKVQELP